MGRLLFLFLFFIPSLAFCQGDLKDNIQLWEKAKSEPAIYELYEKQSEQPGFGQLYRLAFSYHGLTLSKLSALSGIDVKRLKDMLCVESGAIPTFCEWWALIQIKRHYDKQPRS